ncbi:MAG: peroxiredoxin family protein [Bacteroidia bacterium]
MNYKTPLFTSLALSIIAVGLYFAGFTLVSQSVLALSFIMSIIAFKLNGGVASACVHALAAWSLAFIEFKASSPIVASALLVLPLQNSLVEVFFPRIMYHTVLPKLIITPLLIIGFIVGNIIYSTGWPGWVFPGIMHLAATLLTLMIVGDMKALEKASDKGYIIKAGSLCPDFNLPDEGGKMISKSDFAGKYLLMIFVRGDWCPGCHIMLRTYQRNKDKFAERGVNLLSIGPDPLGVNKEMVDKLGLKYHILSDEKQMLARQFCVELQNTGSGIPEDYEFVPLPASFLIDKGGVVRYTSRADKAGEILNPAQVFEVLDTLA